LKAQLAVVPPPPAVGSGDFDAAQAAAERDALQSAFMEQMSQVQRNLSAKTIEAENKKVAAIAEAMKYLENVRRIGRERRAEFINVLDDSDKSWQKMTKEFMSGFETDDKKLFLLQVNEGEGHRFKVRRALRNVAQAVGDPEPNIGGEDLIGGVFGYANALTKALEEAKKTAVQHGKSIKALIEDSKTGKERVAEVAKKHVVELEQKKKEGEAAVEQAKSDEAKTQAQETKQQRRQRTCGISGGQNIWAEVKLPLQVRKCKLLPMAFLEGGQTA